MRRLLHLLRSELKATRASIAVHMIAIFQPTLMFLLMSAVLVFPTFDMRIEASSAANGLIAAMNEVRSPNLPYINPVLIEDAALSNGAQVIVVELVVGRPTAIQHFNLIDSNMVKNYRNRLTAAALVIWNEELGSQAIRIEEYPWLPEERSYSAFFGMAMLPLTAFLAAVMIGGYATAQDFEFDTIREYRLAIAPTGVIIAARILRLVIIGLLGSMVLMVAIGIMTGSWPTSIPSVIVILCPIAVIGGGLGYTVGLTLQKTLPTFVIALTSSFATWMLGGAFGLTAGFGRGYELVSRIIPHTYAVELLFAQYYGPHVGSQPAAITILTAFCVVILLLTSFFYRRRVVARQG